MKISNITITNLKSFRDKISIDFDPTFNIIIGSNASGKSNLLDIVNIILINFFLKTYNLVPNSLSDPKLRMETISPFQNIN